MSQRNSGYERKAGDAYETPAWVTQALIPHLPDFMAQTARTGDAWVVWEPACGSGHMVRALRQSGIDVMGTDIETGVDFLDGLPEFATNAVITNPPYALAQKFIEHALDLTEPVGGLVAMLLRTDFDHAKTRAHLFSGCPAFAKKLVLTRRIIWFAGGPSSPSYNHAWFIWDWQHRGAPTIAYTV
jgi:hypothetical protein